MITFTKHLCAVLQFEVFGERTSAVFSNNGIFPQAEQWWFYYLHILELCTKNLMLLTSNLLPVNSNWHSMEFQQIIKCKLQCSSLWKREKLFVQLLFNLRPDLTRRRYTSRAAAYPVTCSSWIFIISYFKSFNSQKILIVLQKICKIKTKERYTVHGQTVQEIELC